MTRVTAKNQINRILRDTTNGLHKDLCWLPIYEAMAQIRTAGFDIDFTGSKYQHDDKGTPVSKTWTFQIQYGKKPILGIMTAHGAGSVADPLDRYDVSAYVS